MESRPGNPNIKYHAHKGAAARSEIGNFRSSLNSYKGKDSNDWRSKQIPQEVKDLYSWFKALSKGEREFLFEMKGIYEVLKGNMQNNQELLEKIQTGKKFTPLELEQFKLMINTLEKLQKLEYGEKRVNVNVSYKDFRDLMFEE